MAVMSNDEVDSTTIGVMLESIAGGSAVFLNPPLRFKNSLLSSFNSVGRLDSAVG